MLSFFPSAFAREPVKSITLADLIELVRCETWLHEILALRESLAAGNRPAYDAAKRLLPAVMLSGSVRTRSTSAAEEDRAITHSGYLQADLDAKDHPHLTLVQMAAIVREDRHVLAAFISPSGLGLKAIIRIPADLATHRAAFDAAEKHFAKLGLKLDSATKDPGRLCFISHDPDAWLREDATILKPSNKPSKSPRTSPATSHSTTARDIREMLAVIPPRPAYQDWLRIASAVWSVLDEAEGSALLASWSPEERAGEYARKYPQRLRHIHLGTLAWYARLHGFDATAASRRKLPARPSGKKYGKSRNTHDESPQPAPSAPISDPHFLESCLRLEQRGDALLWEAIARGSYLYDHFIEDWRVWRNGCWERDDLEAVKLDFAEALTTAYQRLLDGSKKEFVKSHTKHATDTAHQLIRLARNRIDSLNRVRYLTGSLELARAMPDLATRATAFDRAPHLLAVENGVIDFEAGEFRGAEDMLTHRAAVRYDADADCPLFRAFMHRMLVDPEVVSFVMRAMAYSCTGLVDADVLFFLYGKGANGKSTFMMVFKLLLGELMTTIDIEALLTRRPDSSLDYKKATLEGRRVAVTDEVPAGRKLGESMVKALIGGDEIVARRPYEKPYTFAPTHKLWMVGNHKPVIEGTDTGIWRRICLIPWTQTIPLEERRPRAQVIAGFREELPGILNWILAAWQEFRQLGGLAPPRAVQEATEEYQTEQDQLGAFIEERTTRQPGTFLTAQSVLKAYHEWCDDNGERPIYRSSKLLVAGLRERGLEIYRGHGNTTSIRDLQILTSDLFDR